MTAQATAPALLAAAACVLLLGAPSAAGAHVPSDAELGADTLRVALAAPEGGTVAEGATGHFVVSVAGGTASESVAVQYSVSGSATSGEDFVALSGEVTVAQGAASARIALSALEDGILDKGETVVLTLASATGPGAVVLDASPATATIADNGSVTVALATVPDTIPEGGVWSSQVTMSAPVADRVAVRWWTSDGTAQAGRDYRARDETLLFAPGETSKAVEVEILRDDVVEPVESFHVSLGRPPSASGQSGEDDGVDVDGTAQAAFIMCGVEFPPGTPTRFTVNETAPRGTVVGTVAAEAEGEVEYSLSGDAGSFAIDPVTAAISTTGTVSGDRYDLVVTVEAACGAQDSKDVTVFVNHAPTRVGTIEKQTVDRDETGMVDVSEYFQDPDGDDLKYTAVSSRHIHEGTGAG